MTKALLPAVLCLTAACARELPAPQSVTTWTLPDWTPRPEPRTPSPEAAATSTASFRAPVPAGYRSSDAVLTPPIGAMFVKGLQDGEAAILVERYVPGQPGFADKEAFAANLGAAPGQAYKVRRRFEGKDFEVYEGIEFESLARRIPPADPYADRLGSAFEPPRLSFLESRRFPKGGEAYRLYRCRKEGAWGLLRAYRRLQSKGEDLATFRDRELGRAERGIVSACFGQAALLAMDTGAAVADVPKPSMYRLRIMAREEWTYGASRRVEREAVALRDFAGGFYALRLRAPRSSFAEEYAAFGSFVAGFEPAP